MDYVSGVNDAWLFFFERDMFVNNGLESRL